MSQFTYNERKEIVNLLQSAQKESACSPSSIIQQSSEILNDLPQTLGYDMALHDNMLRLANHARENIDELTQSISISALAYIINNFDLGESESKNNNMRKLVFVSSFAIHQIEGYVEHISTGLKNNERQLAEDMFSEYLNNPLGNDNELMEHVTSTIALFSNSSFSSLITRFKNNLLLLQDIIQNDGSNDDKCWARAALSYLMRNDDIICDSLGLIGHLDDIFVVQEAVTIIYPDRPKWQDLITNIEKNRPYLNDLIFECNNTSYSLSEYMLVNTALTLNEISNKKESEKLKALIMPCDSSTSVIIALVSLFDRICSHLSNSIDDMATYQQGDKVLVDNKSVALYDGIDEIHGVEFIRLKKYTTRQGKKLENISRIPSVEIGRLCPADSEANLRGKINTHRENKPLEVNVLDRMFHLFDAKQVHTMESRVWVVTSVGKAKRLLDSMTLNGQKVSDALPIGHVKSNGEVEQWNSNFGVSEPKLLFVSDLDVAVEAIEGAGSTNRDLIVVDLSGSNRNRISGLEYLANENLQILCVVHEKEHLNIEYLEKNNYKCWQWKDEDIKELVWPPFEKVLGDSHPLILNGQKIYSAYTSNPTLKIVKSELAVQANSSVFEFAEAIKLRGEDIPTMLNEASMLAVECLFLLLRMPFSELVAENVCNKVQGKISEVENIINKTLSATDQEIILLNKLVLNINNFCEEVLFDNKKQQLLSELMCVHEKSAVIIPNRQGFNSLTNCDAFNASNQKIHLNYQAIDSCDAAIIPYWPGKDKAWDLIAPPLGTHAVFVLYENEASWYKSFISRRQRSANKFSTANHRSSIFPFLYENEGKDVIDIEEHFQTDNDADSKVEEIIKDQRRAHFLQAIKSTGEHDVKATLVTFEGCGFSFLAENYEAKLVTHLVDRESSLDREKEKVKTTNVKNIKIDDVLVFVKGSDKDAIRELVDSNLGVEKRQLATLWQRALKKYAVQNNKTFYDLHKELSLVGCKYHLATIKNWLESVSIIGPMDTHRGALDAICKVTQDPDLINNKIECGEAISIIWGEHQKVANQIARNVLNSFDGHSTERTTFHEPLDIGEQLIIARVAEIDNELLDVPYSKTNKILGM